MDEQVGELLTAVLERNGLTADDLISIWFTATPDLHSDFPAAAARKLGIVDVPLICAQELDIEGAMPRVVRILAHIESDLPRADIAHVYLGAAARPPQGHRPVRTALVIGTGLIGTSAALALAARGVAVHLADHDPEQARTAAALGAGTDEAPDGPVDLAIVAVPPAHVAGALADAMRRGPGPRLPRRGQRQGRPAPRAGGARAATCRLHRHATPCRAGRSPARWPRPPTSSRAGPGCSPRPADTDTEVLNLALELVALCRAVPVVMDADAHDRAVALVSHTPQLVSSMVAARLENADETAVRLCGQGIRDVTRIAASDPRMWIDILSANPGPVADVLADVAADLDETVRALRALQSVGRGEAARAAPAASRTCCAAATRAGSGCPASTGPRRASTRWWPC